ncbi:MAG: hypothetical protein OXC37_05375 [Bdellovibrionaceae bacterium]|nr:hypothetical protein [Pseudobdellovibrionaceae bacterium]
MRVLFVIILNTIRQAFRKKFLAGLLVACFAILLLSLVFAQLSLDDKGRLTVDFGLASVQILLAILAIFFGSSFISDDLDKKILWTILTKPVRPTIFFLGRYLSLSILLVLSSIVLSSLLILFFVFLQIPIQLILFYALLGFLLESLLLLAFVILFSSFVSSFLVSFYCISVFIIGHFLDSLFYFIKEGSERTSFFYNLLYLLPNLERVNWKSEVVYQDRLAFLEFASSSVYIFLWIGLVLSLALIIMEKREF